MYSSFSTEIYKKFADTNFQEDEEARLENCGWLAKAKLGQVCKLKLKYSNRSNRSKMSCEKVKRVLFT